MSELGPWWSNTLFVTVALIAVLLVLSNVMFGVTAWGFSPTTVLFHPLFLIPLFSFFLLKPIMYGTLISKQI